MRKKQPMTTEESAWYSGMLVSVFVAVFTIRLGVIVFVPLAAFAVCAFVPWWKIRKRMRVKRELEWEKVGKETGEVVKTQDESDKTEESETEDSELTKFSDTVAGAFFLAFVAKVIQAIIQGSTGEIVLWACASVFAIIIGAYARKRIKENEENFRWTIEYHRNEKVRKKRQEEERAQKLQQLNDMVATVNTSGGFVEVFQLVATLGEEDGEQKAYFKEALLERLNALLNGNRSIRALEGADYIATQFEDDPELQRRIGAMVSLYLKVVELNPTKVEHISSKGRPCYYTGQVYQIQRKKRGNEFYYDKSTAKLVTFFIYKDLFEWMTDDEFYKLAIKNIMVTMDVTHTILTVKPTTKDIFFFYGRKVEFIKAVIEKLQEEITRSW